MSARLHWIIVVLIILAATGSQQGCSRASDEEITAAAERAAYEKKITFTVPIEWTAKVTQCSVKDACKTRYYYPKEKR